MKDRVRKLRKEILHLNQTEFGRKLGIGQQSIANIESGTNALTERNFDAICRTWDVNPNWLRYGEGEVFVEKKESLLQSLVREFELTPDEEALVAALLDLPPEYRAGVVRYVKEAAARFEETLADKMLEDIPLHKMTPEQKRAVINRQLDLEEEALKKERASLASTITTTSKKTSNTS